MRGVLSVSLPWNDKRTSLTYNNITDIVKRHPIFGLYHISLLSFLTYAKYKVFNFMKIKMTEYAETLDYLDKNSKSFRYISFDTSQALSYVPRQML